METFKRILLPVMLIVALSVLAVGASRYYLRRSLPIRSVAEQACGLPEEWLERARRGYFEGRSGEISLLPQTPAYMTSAAGGWTHTGPWPYVQRVPLVFYGPGIIPATGEVDRPATVADIAPTFATLMKGALNTGDSRSLDEAARLDAPSLSRDPPRLIVTIVWDGGGWNVLERWPDAWPNLKAMMTEGVSYTDATVGSSPSVTPAVHATIGTGAFPWQHGVTDIPMRDDDGRVVDAFFDGESSRFLEMRTFAEIWDEQNGNDALVAMVGYEPWHLGMIGKGAESPNGDKDDAAWLHHETNEWITNPDHYRLPSSLASREGLEEEIRRLDLADGRDDGAWSEHDWIDDPERLEESPAFIAYHAQAMMRMIEQEGYGDDDIADLVFTNFKQPDRLGHYFNMRSTEVRDAVAASDRALGELEPFLDEEVGRGNWVIVVTADHGQQPDAGDIDAYGVDSTELRRDLDDRFGEITRAVWPTQAFLREDAMEEKGVEVDEVARFISDYRLSDNTRRPDIKLAGAGQFDPHDRLFAMAIPSRALPSIDCSGT
jgi:arylsulfatase A-like enzyme